MKVLISVFIAILGAVMGSFYACMGYRIPNKISLVKPNSFCEVCKKELKWYMNVPIFSYIFLKGKCAYCKNKISPVTFIVEILTSILFLVIYLKYEFSLIGILLLVLTSVLSVTIVSDFLYYYISDRVLVIAYVVSLIAIILKGDVFSSLISSIVMFSIFLIVKLLGDKIFKRESLGGGDVKLMALIGLNLGIFPSLISLVISSTTALIYALLVREKREIPFGPFLLIGALIILYFTPYISL